MKTWILGVLAWIFCCNLVAQSVSFSPPSLSFSQASLIDIPGNDPSEELGFQITNAGQQAIAFDSVVLQTYFEDGSWSMTSQPLNLAAGTSDSIHITFSPKQDITHRSAVLFYSDTNVWSYPVTGVASWSTPGALNTTQDQWEGDLIQVIRTYLTQFHIQLSYNQARDVMFMDIYNQQVNPGAPQNTLECVYTGSQITGYVDRQAAQNLGFNTEHTYPQSAFNSQMPMRSDLHHLFPTTATSNSQRGNLSFGEVTGTPTWQQGGSKKSSTLFEPRDEQKGMTARAMLYFLLRYGNIGNYVGASQESVLYEWHRDFLPDALERWRTEIIEAEQGAYNPLVRYPALLDRISSIRDPQPLENYDSLFVTHTRIDVDTMRTSPTYAVAIQNLGRRTISLSNFNLSDDTYVSVSGYSGVSSLPPGGLLTLEVSFNYTLGIEFSEQFTWQTDVAGAQTELILEADWDQSTSISEQARGEQDIRIFPNPAQDYVRIEGEYRTVSVYTLQGQLIMHQARTGNVLNLSGLSSGAYVIQVDTEYGRVNQRLLVQ